MQECCQAWKADGPEIASAAKAPAAAQPAFPNRFDLLRAQRPRAVPAIPRPKPVPATPFDAYSLRSSSYSCTIYFSTTSIICLILKLMKKYYTGFQCGYQITRFITSCMDILGTHLSNYEFSLSLILYHYKTHSRIPLCIYSSKNLFCVIWYNFKTKYVVE